MQKDDFPLYNTNQKIKLVTKNKELEQKHAKISEEKKYILRSVQILLETFHPRGNRNIYLLYLLTRGTKYLKEMMNLLPFIEFV